MHRSRPWGFLVAFVLVGLVLLVRTNLAEQQLRWRVQRVYFSPDIAWDFLRNGLAFSVIIVALAWVLPGLGRNPQVREFLAPVNGAWENTSQSVQRLYQGLNRQAQERGATFGDSLTLGGERNVTDSPVFQVATSQGRYWRAVAFDTYDGRSWQNTADGAAEVAAGEIVPVASWRARQGHQPDGGGAGPHRRRALWGAGDGAGGHSPEGPGAASGGRPAHPSGCDGPWRPGGRVHARASGSGTGSMATGTPL